MKKNKSGDIKIILVLLVILVVCFSVIGVLFYKYFYAGTSSSKYGDRLDGIEKYQLSDTLESDIKKVYENTKSIGSVKVNVKGKIIYINIDFIESVKIETAKTEAVKSLEKIGEENLTYYDVQYILSYSGKEENENFPVFGAKSSSSLKVVW